jgi:hypothetical protein
VRIPNFNTKYPTFPNLPKMFRKIPKSLRNPVARGLGLGFDEQNT